MERKEERAREGNRETEGGWSIPFLPRLRHACLNIHANSVHPSVFHTCRTEQTADFIGRVCIYARVSLRRRSSFRRAQHKRGLTSVNTAVAMVQRGAEMPRVREIREITSPIRGRRNFIRPPRPLIKNVVFFNCGRLARSHVVGLYSRRFRLTM